MRDAHECPSFEIGKVGMGRKARFLKDGGCYYIQIQSFLGKEIFKEDHDYRWIIQLFRRYKLRYGVNVYAYCLLPMEVHLIVHPRESRNLPQFMQGVNQAYAKHFNCKYNHSGKVWGQRYRSALIHNDKDLVDAVKLVEFIPVEKKQSCSPTEYPWSSCSLRILGSGSIIDTMPPENPVESLIS